jgi:Domain of unknown function (DUF4124)
MNKDRLLVALSVCSVLVTASVWGAESKGNKTYRWVDDKGIVHYSDTVPPESAREGHAELNSQGVSLREFPKQLTTEEAAAAQRVAADEQKRKQHDQFLLTTYTASRDIEQLRDERLALIDGQMEIARGSIVSVSQRLTTLETRVRTFKPYSPAANARRLPDQLAEEVVRTLQEKRSLQDALASRENQKTEMRAQFDTDLARYRVLTAKPTIQPR